MTIEAREHVGTCYGRWIFPLLQGSQPKSYADPPSVFLSPCGHGAHESLPGHHFALYKTAHLVVSFGAHVARVGRDVALARQIFEGVRPGLLELHARGISHSMLCAGMAVDSTTCAPVVLGLGFTPMVAVDSSWSTEVAPESRSGVFAPTAASDVHNLTRLVCIALVGKPLPDEQLLKELAHLVAPSHLRFLKAGLASATQERPKLAELGPGLKGLFEEFSQRLAARDAHRPKATPPPFTNPRKSTAPAVVHIAEAPLPAATRQIRPHTLGVMRQGHFIATPQQLVLHVGAPAERTVEARSPICTAALTRRGDVLTTHADGSVNLRSEKGEHDDRELLARNIAGPLSTVCPHDGDDLLVAGAAGVVYRTTPDGSAAPSCIDRDAPRQAPITAMLRAANGDWFVGGLDGVRMFGGVTAATAPTLHLPTPARSIALLESRRLLAVVGFDQQVRVYDLHQPTPTPRATLPTTGAASVAWLPWNGDLLLADARGARLYDRDGRPVLTIHDLPTHAVAVDPQRRQVSLALAESILTVELQVTIDPS